MDIDPAHPEDDRMDEEEGEEEDFLTKELVSFIQFIDIHEQSQFQDKAAMVGNDGGRFRRKSVLPVDADVMTELSRHKSLEDLLSSKEKDKLAGSPK